MNLKNLKKEEGIQGVAKHVMREYQSANQFRRKIETVQITTRIYKPFYDYVFATARSERKLGERMNEIILAELRQRVGEEKGMF